MKKIVFSSKDISDKCVRSLLERGFSPVLLPEYPRLQKGVSSHPDMLFFFYKRKYICTKEYFMIAKDVTELLSQMGYSPVISNETPSPEYPHDVIFNALMIGKYIFGNEKALSKSLIELAEAEGVEIVNVKQGYTKCSVCKVSENAIITADKGIAKEASLRGIDVLTVSPEGVLLNGYDCGFIGGASGSDQDAVYFCGDIMTHPDGAQLSDFCRAHGKECISLSDEPLFDVGTLFFV